MLAILLTIVSFAVSQTNLLWPPGVVPGLIVLALAQIGVHLVFFLHVGIGSDNTNNVLALAFGALVVFLVIAGAIGIMANLSYMMPYEHAALTRLRYASALRSSWRRTETP